MSIVGNIRLANENENNLKLDTEAGAVPQHIYIRSKRDSDEHVELPTIDMTTNPFTVDTDNNVHSPTDAD